MGTTTSVSIEKSPTKPLAKTKPKTTTKPEADEAKTKKATTPRSTTKKPAKKPSEQVDSKLKEKKTRATTKKAGETKTTRAKKPAAAKPRVSKRKKPETLMDKTTELLKNEIPRIRKLLRETTQTALRNETAIMITLGGVYFMMPVVVKAFVPESLFVKFCMENIHALIDDPVKKPA